MVLEHEPRFVRFEVRNFQVRSNIKWKIYQFFDIICSKILWFGSRFGLFWVVREVRGSEFSGSFQYQMENIPIYLYSMQ